MKDVFVLYDIFPRNEKPECILVESTYHVYCNIHISTGSRISVAVVVVIAKETENHNHLHAVGTRMSGRVRKNRRSSSQATIFP